MSATSDALVTNARAPAAPLAWPLALAAALLALPTLLALLTLLGAWTTPAPELWQHLRSYVLPDALFNTVLLTLGVGALAGLLGGGLAALTTMCEFPGRAALAWLLVLPLAVPTYVMAFVYVGAFDFGGGLQALAMRVTGSAAWLPSLRNVPGAAVVLALALYPYVYLLVRAVLRQQGAGLFEVARVQGRTPLQALFTAVLPACRPALLAGVGLAMLETLADFGAVSALGVDTLATAIYKTWFALGSLPVAAQLASILLLMVLLVQFLERRERGRAAHAGVTRRVAPPIVLRGAAAWCAGGLGFAVLALGFGVPLLQLLFWSARAGGGFGVLIEPLGNTVSIAAGAAVLIAAAGAVLAAAVRAAHGAARWRWLRDLSGLGYAVPGTVLAVAVMLGLIALDHVLRRWGLDPGALFTGSLLALWLALLVRFQRVGIGAADAALAQLPPSFGEAARTLGSGRLDRIRRLYLPALRPGLLAGALLAFVEVAKELPATLMLRPLGRDTLAVKIYSATSEGLWAEAALPALVLMLVGLVPSWLLLRRR